MKWMLLLIFLNPAGGIAVEKIPMANEALCAEAIKAVSSGIFEAPQIPKVLLVGATYFEVGSK